MNILQIITHLFAVVVQVFFPILLGWWLVRRYRLPWGIFLVGALFFVVSQLAEAPIAAIILILDDNEANRSFFENSFVLAAFGGLVAGLFEETSRYVGFRVMRIMQRNRTWPAALLSGAGHGGAESVMIGLSLLVFLIVGLTAPELLEQAPALSEVPTWHYLLSALERIFAVILHISFAVLIFQIFARRQWWWWLVAVGYHALVDFAVVLLARAELHLSQNLQVLLAEGLTVVFALISLGIILALRETPPRLAQEEE